MSSRTGPLESLMISVTTLNAPSAYNFIPDHVEISGTVGPSHAACIEHSPALQTPRATASIRTSADHAAVDYYCRVTTLCSGEPGLSRQQPERLSPVEGRDFLRVRAAMLHCMSCRTMAYSSTWSNTAEPICCMPARHATAGDYASAAYRGDAFQTTRLFAAHISVASAF